MITKIEASSFTGKTFQSKYGTMYVHSVTINGEVGSANAKTEMPDHFKVGTEVEVERTEDEFGVKFKISKPKEAQNNGFKKPFDPAAEDHRQKMITRQSSLKLAFDYLSMQNKAFTPGDVMSLSDVFTDYVMK